MKATEFVHMRINKYIKEGHFAIDGTCGNGHDTVFLAEKVGDNGKVWAFDIQQMAIEKTTERLIRQGLEHRVQIIHDDHRNINRYPIPKCNVIMFNLGYLPGGNHRITTTVTSSLKAIEESLGLLLHGGLLSVVCYRGHDGGEEEYQSILKMLSQLPHDRFLVSHFQYLNQLKKTPVAIIVEKRVVNNGK